MDHQNQNEVTRQGASWTVPHLTLQNQGCEDFFLNRLNVSLHLGCNNWQAWVLIPSPNPSAMLIPLTLNQSLDWESQNLDICFIGMGHCLGNTLLRRSSEYLPHPIIGWELRNFQLPAEVVVICWYIETTKNVYCLFEYCIFTKLRKFITCALFGFDGYCAYETSNSDDSCNINHEWQFFLWPLRVFRDLKTASQSVQGNDNPSKCISTCSLMWPLCLNDFEQWWHAYNPVESLE